MSPRSAKSRDRAATTFKPRLFLGSSSEARDRGILDILGRYLSRGFQVRRWDEEFNSAGQYNLETLLAIAKSVEAALIVFARDDRRDSRGATETVPRDNVIWEHALCTTALGRERVWTLVEEGSAVPSDLLGVSYWEFRGDGNEFNRDDLRKCAELAYQRWESVNSPLPQSFDNHDLYIEVAVRNEAARNSLLWSRVESGKASEEPIWLHSRPASLDAYEEGLGNVANRFWTTTLLDSDFWTRRIRQVIEANQRLLTRLHGRAGGVRRVFILSDPPDATLSGLKSRIAHLRQERRYGEADRVINSYRNMASTIRQLIEIGCEVVLTAQKSIGHEMVPNFISSLLEQEIAIYDEFRVDVFEEGISGTRVFSRLTSAFPDVKYRAARYFEHLWDSGKPAASFFTALDKALSNAEHHIDYTRQWLIKFHQDLSEQDRRLKAAEVDFAQDTLRKHRRWGKVRSYLDVGTCTGRYLLALREAVARTGDLLGIDSDRDCVEFAKAIVKDDPRVRIQQLDLLFDNTEDLGRFDLITCMLSTVSHFGHHPHDFQDRLQLGIARMASLLVPEGLLLLTKWSAGACRNEGEGMLSVYEDEAKRRLVRWTPSSAELKERIEAAGLEVVSDPEAAILSRLDLFVCRPR